MRAEPNKLEARVVRLSINQDQVGPDVAVAVIAPLAAERMIEIPVCIIGTIIWAVPLVTASVIVDPAAITLGVIIGGGLTASGILVISLPTHPIRVSYFDKRP